MARIEARERREAEAREVGNNLRAQGYEAIYGGSKGHGFWVRGQGWKQMQECVEALEVLSAITTPGKAIL